VLLLVSFLPFPTKLVGEFVRETDPERVAAVFYGLTLLALSLALTAFIRYAAEHRRLVRNEIEAESVEAALTHQPSFLLYGIGALYLGIPGRTLHRLLRRWRPARA
jgi:uncharacterized membrane protein